MFFTLPGLIFNIIGVLALMRSEWLQKQYLAGTQDVRHGNDHTTDPSRVCLPDSDLDAAFSLWMLGGLALVFGFGLHVAALFA
jgi:hypothetical protein